MFILSLNIRWLTTTSNVPYSVILAKFPRGSTKKRFSKFLRKVRNTFMFRAVKCNSRFYNCDPEIMTIQAALAPLLIICSFCSLGLIEYPLGQPRPYFTCLYVLTIWSLFSYFFYYLVYNSYTLSLVYLSWPNTIIMITAIVSMLVSLFRFKVSVLKYTSNF